MKKVINYFFALVFILSIQCSESFLEETLPNEIEESDISVNIVEGFVNAAYAPLNGQYDEGTSAFKSAGSNWAFGDVTSDNYYKGGGGVGDQATLGSIEAYRTTPDLDYIQSKFVALYEGVNRTITAIHYIETTNLLTPEDATQRIAEMKFLQAHYYFELKKIYDKIAILPDEPNIDYANISNKDFTNKQVWDKIESLLKEAKEVLPKVKLQKQKGRPTYYAAVAYLAKVALFQEKWAEVQTYCDTLIKSTEFNLLPDFAGLFQVENEHCSEVIFAIEQVINDGTTNHARGSIGDRLFPPGGPYSDYGFLRPTYNMLNAYRTKSGLPNLDADPTYKVLLTDPVDPRLDITIGRPGIPYYDLGNYEESWARYPHVYGIYGPKKRILSWNSRHMLQQWPFVNELNFYIIRYADVLLWKAEALLMSGGAIGEAVQLINQVRSRIVDNPHTWVKTTAENGTVMNAGNYQISTYPISLNQAEALMALKIERRLEFAGEGTRFFDLVRWGDAEPVLNEYINNEVSIAPHLKGAVFSQKNNYMPIPQSMVDAGWEQNPGY